MVKVELMPVALRLPATDIAEMMVLGLLAIPGRHS
jgi:hypothetical protein